MQWFERNRITILFFIIGSHGLLNAWTGRYWDADINRQASVNVIPTCLPIGSDDEDANQMHERVVEAVVAILEANDD